MPRYVKCNLCGQGETEVVQEAESPFKVVRCRNCGLVFTNPQPEAKLIEDHYQEGYYREWIEKQMKKRISMWKKRLKELKGYRVRGRLLDVGCGLGTFLKLAEEEKFEIQGTELSEYVSRYAKENLGIDVFRGSLEDAHFPGESFDVVTVWHTLEHLPDPKSTLKEINRLMKKEGLLVVATPNLSNHITRILYLIAKRKKLKLFSSQAKEWHLYHFSENTLSSMLKATGFEIIKKGLDLSQIETPKKIVDFLTAVVYFLTGKNFGQAMKFYALKQGEP